VNIARRVLISKTGICFVMLSAAVMGQRTKRLPRVALVFSFASEAEISGANPTFPLARAFVNALRDFGLVEGRNVIIDRRSAEGGPERMDALMHELVALDVDVIVATGPDVSVAQRATDRIPIVGVVDRAVDAGLIDSLARPGRNVTGFGDKSPSGSKQLQLLKEAVPRISRVAIIAPSPSLPVHAAWRDELDAAARSLQLDLRWIAVDTPEDFEPAFAAIIRERANALFVMNTVVNYRALRRIADFATERQLPSVCIWAEFARAGGLLSYGSDNLDAMRHAAAYVKKILDGAKPSDLPFEQPAKFEFTVNLKTAKALGLEIPQSLILRADEVIQ
jgi:putative ABC transport system substrate-binding protein